MGKVSTHVSLRGPRRLTWSDTFFFFFADSSKPLFTKHFSYLSLYPTVHLFTQPGQSVRYKRMRGDEQRGIQVSITLF